MARKLRAPLPLPEDKNASVTRWSYALNVFYELNPDGDDYDGSPRTWRRVAAVPHPARTILLAEPRSLDFGNHIMCHLWRGTAAAQYALDYKRHGAASNYLFLDGHVETLPLDAVYSPAKRIQPVQSLAREVIPRPAGRAAAEN